MPKKDSAKEVASKSNSKIRLIFLKIGKHSLFMVLFGYIS